MAVPHHLPVLAEEVINLLSPQPGEHWVDVTVGLGGHTKLIANRVVPRGHVLGLDQDATMLELARATLQGLPVTLIAANFDQLGPLLASHGWEQIDGLFADLGVCSAQLDDPHRGFSFREDGPLDMRLDPSSGETASDLVQRLSEGALADLFWEYGEERYSRRIARRIVQSREQEPITTTRQLAELVRRCVPRRGSRIDPATRVFQALRIAVNDERGALERLLRLLPKLIRPGGRVGIISFHSLEDRPVKQALRDETHWERLTKKPVVPGDEEINRNPRARSAKLRVARRR